MSLTHRFHSTADYFNIIINYQFIICDLAQANRFSMWELIIILERRNADFITKQIFFLHLTSFICSFHQRKFKAIYSKIYRTISRHHLYIGMYLCVAKIACTVQKKFTFSRFSINFMPSMPFLDSLPAFILF